MDIGELTNCIGLDGEDILTEVHFQDWFGVSLSDELRLLETKREAALKMMRHSGAFVEWQSPIATSFQCLHFNVRGMQYQLGVRVFDTDNPSRFQVKLLCGTLLKFNEFGDNLVALLYKMFKSELVYAD